MSYADCHPSRPNRGRGLCPACYTRAKRMGTLSDHPPRGWPGGRPVRCVALTEDAAWIRATTGAPVDVVAERLGVTVEALKKAMQRARKYVA